MQTTHIHTHSLGLGFVKPGQVNRRHRTVEASTGAAETTPPVHRWPMPTTTVADRQQGSPAQPPAIGDSRYTSDSEGTGINGQSITGLQVYQWVTAGSGTNQIRQHKCKPLLETTSGNTSANHFWKPHHPGQIRRRAITARSKKLIIHCQLIKGMYRTHQQRDQLRRYHQPTDGYKSS